MEVELVEAWVVAVMSELGLELQLVPLDGKATDGTERADGDVEPAWRELFAELAAAMQEGACAGGEREVAGADRG